MSSNCECTKQTDVDSTGGLSAVRALYVHTHSLSHLILMRHNSSVTHSLK